MCCVYIFLYAYSCIYRHTLLTCVYCTRIFIHFLVCTRFLLHLQDIYLYHILYYLPLQKLPSELLPLIWVSLKAFGSTDTLTRLIDVPKPYFSLKRVGTGWGTRMNSKMIRRTQVEVALHTNTSILPPPPPTQHQPQQRHPQQGKAVSRQVQYKSSHESYDASTETAETAEIVDSYNHMHIENNNSSKQTSSSSSAAVTSSYRGPDSHNNTSFGGRKRWPGKGAQGKQNKPTYPPRPPSAIASTTSSSSSQPLKPATTATTSSTAVTLNKPNNNMNSNNAKSSSSCNERTVGQVSQKKQRQNTNTNTTSNTSASSSSAAT